MLLDRADHEQIPEKKPPEEQQTSADRWYTILGIKF